METLGAARLAKEIPAQRAVATIVPREEITAVLQDPDADPELFLRITGDGFALLVDERCGFSEPEAAANLAKVFAVPAVFEVGDLPAAIDASLAANLLDEIDLKP